jgi:hypothetical protein
VLLDRYGEIELSSPDADRWVAEHFGGARAPGWLPGPVADAVFRALRESA